MRFIILISICSLLFNSIFLSQPQDKSTHPYEESNNFYSNSTTKRALIIGISKYLYWPNLHFAVDDANAVDTFLHSNSGGSIENNKIKSLLDTEVTIGSISQGIRRIYEDSKAGDTVYIYFSGHGCNGYLMCYQTKMDYIDIMTAYPVYELLNKIDDMAKNDVHVILIIDACYSGQFRENDFGKETKNIVKLLSSQKDETSKEDSRWKHYNIPNSQGGGVFTYNLLVGLYGLAANSIYPDQVHVEDIRSFVKSKVREQTGLEQHPEIYGEDEDIISFVDKKVLNDVQLKIHLDSLRFKPNKSGGCKEINDIYVISSDSLYTEDFNRFKEYINEKKTY